MQAAKRLLTPAALQRLRTLDAVWGDEQPYRGAVAAPMKSPLNTDAKATGQQQPVDFDVALVGGGLSLLLAPLLARRGLTVVVVERALDGTPHREWNASHKELQVLINLELLTEAELQQVVVARYDEGICRWHGGNTQLVHGVLDCAVDAAALWHLARARATAAGVVLWSGVTVIGEHADDTCVTLALQPDASCPHELPPALRVRAMVDGRGAGSPYARGDLVCPTAGGVLTGLTPGDGPQEINARVGEILVTTEGVEDGRQHLWEAFPGREGEVAVYLFYYAERGTLGPRPLEQLYERFVANMSRYKSGPWRLVRPTYGMIPGSSRLRSPATSPHPRVVLVGDAAGRQSPLTFCGFGAMLRSLSSATDGIERAAQGKTRATSVVDDAPVHQVTGVLALMLARARRHGPGKTNELLNAAFGTLERAGESTMNALLQDTMHPDDAVRFMWDVGQIYPGVWPAVLKQLGPKDACVWAWRMRGPLRRGMLQARSSPSY